MTKTPASFDDAGVRLAIRLSGIRPVAAVRLAFRRSQSGFVIRVVGDLFDVLDVFDLALAVDHEDRSAEAAVQHAAGNQDAVVLTKLAAAMGTQRLDVGNPFGSAPAFLPEGQVHTDDQDLDVGQVLDFVVESLGFGMAGRSIERRDGRDHSRLASAGGQCHASPLG